MTSHHSARPLAGVFVNLTVASVYLLVAGAEALSPSQPLPHADAGAALTAKPPALAADGLGAAYRAADPRLDAACRAAHGAPPAPVGGVLGVLNVRTVEDVFCPDAGQRARLHNTFFWPYGRLLNTTGAVGSALFVEVPKAGSSAFKEALDAFYPSGSQWKASGNEMWRIVKAKRPVPAFAIVREPLARALSAFGEVRTRMGPLCQRLRPKWKQTRRWPVVCEEPWVHTPNTSVALAGYTDWLTNGGLVRAAAAPDVFPRVKEALMHAFSQTFFLSLCPLKLAGVVRLEAAEAGLRAFEAQHGQLLRWSKGSPLRPRLSLNRRNADHGRVVRTLGRHGHLADPAILRRLEEYYRQDFVCLDYARTTA